MKKRAILVPAVSTPAQARDHKESLPAQERELLEIAKREDWDVIDIIRIPGFSRSYYTLRELVEAAAKKGEYGPKRLEEHIEAADFDVLAVRATNRFGREQSLTSEIIGKVVRKCRAEVYSVLDGVIGRNNQRPMAAITAYRDASEIDELVKKRQTGIVGRINRGLPSNGKPPFSHRLIRNSETGKVEGMEVREELRPLFNDLATVLLDGVGLLQLERALYDRYGYVAPNGKPYPSGKFNVLLLTPQAWGNNAIRWRDTAKMGCRGVWAFDPAVPPPEGVMIRYGTHPSVYTGELAQQVQAELRRRTDIANGPALHIGIKKFSGLVICHKCGWRYQSSYSRHANGNIYMFLRCNKTYQRRLLQTCDQYGNIPESD